MLHPANKPFRLCLLLVLVVAMQMVRLVDLHWHQHFGENDPDNHPPATFVFTQAAVVMHLADISTAHAVEDLDADLHLVGDDGRPMPHVVIDTLLFALLIWLLPLGLRVTLPALPLRSPPRLWRGTAPPPSQAPPLSI